MIFLSFCQIPKRGQLGLNLRTLWNGLGGAQTHKIFDLSLILSFRLGRPHFRRSSNLIHVQPYRLRRRRLETSRDENPAIPRFKWRRPAVTTYEKKSAADVLRILFLTR